MKKKAPIWSDDSVAQDYRKIYAIAGVIVIATRWRQRHFAESVEEITAITSRVRGEIVPIGKEEYFPKKL